MKNLLTHKTKTTSKIKQYGIGLLELMLSLTIIAILLVAATRYYQSTQTSRQIEIAMDSIQAVYAATQQYYNDNGSAPKTLQDLKNNAMLPSNFDTFANPWGGKVTASNPSQNELLLTFQTTVPAGACNNIQTKIQANYSPTDVQVTKCPQTDIGDMSICYLCSTTP